MKAFFALLLVFLMLIGEAQGQRCGTESSSLSLPFHQWFNKIAASQNKNKVNALCTFYGCGREKRWS
jgi:hypothetical protein